MTERIASLNVKRRRLADLKPHPQNPRTHPEEGSPAWEVLKRSLDFDYFDGLILNERNGYLVAGHFRLKVMLTMGFIEADVIIVDYDDKVHHARMSAANVLLGEFDELILASLAKEIDEAGLDSAIAGLTEKAMLALLECPEVGDDTEQTEELVSKADLLQQKWKVALGDLYEIGGLHRLLCGDCASDDNWQMLLEGQLGDMMWTDPPYNINYLALQEHRIETKLEQGSTPTQPAQEILNDDLDADDYRAKLLEWFTYASKRLKPGASIYIAHADMWRIANQLAAEQAGFKIAQNLIWVKNSFTLGRQDYQWQHEPILYGWKKGDGHYWQGGFSHSTTIDERPDLKKKSKTDLIAIIDQMWNAQAGTVQRLPRSSSEGLHPTIKPLPLVANHIWNSSKTGEVVVELFNGSGTTMAAAHHTGRRCVATELEPKYVAVGLERMALLGLSVKKLRSAT